MIIIHDNMNYETLKAAIVDVIKQNGNEEITGNLLQQTLVAMVNSLGAGYQFMGIAEPATNPGTIDQRAFYIAGAVGSKSLPNFGLTISNEICVLTYGTAWTKTTILAIDSSPVANSKKLISSGAVYTAINNLPTPVVIAGGGTNAIIQKGGANSATGDRAAAFGSETKAAGTNAASFGRLSEATGLASFAAGQNNKANSWGAAAFGGVTEANGNYAMTQGAHTKTTNTGEMAMGSYNVTREGTTQMSVGVGTSNTKRKNALEITIDGKVFVLGAGGYTGVASQDLANVTDLATLLANFAAGPLIITVTNHTSSDIHYSAAYTPNGDMTFDDILAAYHAGRQIMVKDAYARQFVVVSEGNYVDSTRKALVFPNSVQQWCALVAEA